jgi:FKBP-type peptidyl-prolyl cis-trans isomerase
MAKITAALAALLTTACLFSVSDAQTRNRSSRKTSAKSVHKQTVLKSGAVRTASGLTYMVLKRGTGRLPKNGETVIYHYTGTFTNGVKFDSSWDRDQPLAFKLGARQLIKGVEEAIAKLHMGDHAIMVLPPELAYGKRGFRDAIPPNSTLVFLVEIVDIKEMSIADVLLKSNDGAAMVAKYREMKTAGFGKVYTTEDQLNGLGYSLLRQKRIDDAIAILKLNTEEYPRSANTFDSLGEAYVAAGNKQLAIENYQKAVEIDPTFKSSIDALKKLRGEQ